MAAAVVVSAAVVAEVQLLDLAVVAQLLDLADLALLAQLPVLAVEAQLPVLADLVVEAEALVELLSRRSFSAAMAGSTALTRATYEPVPRSS